MATTEPQKWDATLGSTADVNAIPETTPSGSGRASFSGLFPPVTQLPLRHVLVLYRLRLHRGQPGNA